MTKQAKKLKTGHHIIHVGKIWRVVDRRSAKYEIEFERTSIKASDTVLTLLGIGETRTKLLQVAAEHQFECF